MGEIIKVGMADLKICKAPDGLITLGLGSCVGIAMWDPLTKIGGLLHVMLPDSKAIVGNTSKLEKFADTGIEEMVRQLSDMGANSKRLVAKIAGGATMFQIQSRNDIMKIGERNVQATIQKLTEMNIRVLAQDTGENYGRTVTFFPETGEFHIRAIGHENKII